MSTFVPLHKVAEVNPRLKAGSLPLDAPVSFIPMSAVSELTKRIVSADARSYAEVKTGYTYFEEGDVIVAKITPCFENGKMALAYNLPHSIAFGSTEFHVFRAGEKILNSYLFHFLQSPKVQTNGAAQMKGAAGQKRVPADYYKTLQIPLPPLPEQKRIAAILDAADSMRAKRRESLHQLDLLLQSTFLDMFGDTVTNSKGWKLVSMESIVGGSFRNGLSASTHGTIEGKVLTLSSITSGRFDGSFWKSVKFDRQPSENQMLSSDTFLICRGNGNKAMVGIGVFPTNSNSEITFPDTIIASTPDKSKILPAYLQHIWASQMVRSQIIAGARTTNGTYKINQSVLSGIKFPLPPIDLQRSFATIVEAVEKQKDRLRAHLAELDTLFASLQHRAFNGEL
ncbi:type I restriction enzyme S subunit [Desulfomicrobium macestii]|uniref:Type I restriction enzyme S subunit n=1 Tax=Desulfomicrobium macestii TaxID=90731 RepID=A0ABR9H9A4_9BACT|nr:restriction endonuclease subunit S [Desulfomicrobium macestii]MBE1427289.1 type I restriction enzyme S subunit [Desulfomicrobium macestii]